MVIFHAPTHNRDGVRFPPNKYKAIYTLVSMEQPLYARMLSNTADLQKNFDIVATYSLQAKYPGTNIPNLPFTYYPLNILSVNAVVQPSRPFTKKNGFGTGMGDM